MNQQKNISQKDWDVCISVLQKLKDAPELAHDELLLKGIVSKMYKQARKRTKKEAEIEQTLRTLESYKQFTPAQLEHSTPMDLLKKYEQEAKEATYIFQKNDDRSKQSFSINQASSTKTHRHTPCYVCKKRYTKLDTVYHMLCPDCATINFTKRNQTTDLSKRIVLLTGGRIKIGFELGLKMLRDGATLITTTRFPNDAKQRYEAIEDYNSWSDRLHIFGLDLRKVMQIDQFINKIFQDYPHLDIIINNAAQTISRPIAFYQHLLEKEENNYLINTQSNTNQIALFEKFFPAQQLDKDAQQIDLRPHNSWVSKLEEVDLREMLEVQLVNVTAPFLLNSRLKPLLLKSPFKDKFIVNVSAMEGQFYRKNKTVFHPHTNMAKAALNMMTRTSAADYAKDHIYMNSVDTGWITNENPHPKKERMRDHHFVPPLDVVDGAARVYDPIVSAINDKERTPLYGLFLKDYRQVPW